MVINQNCVSAIRKIRGGQSMIFNTFEGKTMFVMHATNESPLERAVIRELNLTDVLDTE